MEATSAYAQLASVGLLWMSFHCAGMCGPLLIGLDVTGAARGCGAVRGMGHVLTYQLGRALMYALFGVAVGAIGAQLGAWFTWAGGIFALAFGLVAVGVGTLRAWQSAGTPLVAGPKRPDGTAGDTEASVESWLARTVRKLLGEERGFVETLALGGLMAFLPCMITFWAMGLAATTQSPIHGAGVMVLLVVMTTPMLLGVTLLPRFVLTPVWKRLGPQGRARTQAALILISGSWLVMVGLAGLEVVEHVHINLTLWEEPLTIMLW